jgi:hypothetical protein
MSSVVISGDTSGAITLAAPAVAGTNTATLPAATGDVMVSGNMPLITVKLSTAQSCSGAAQTVVAFDTELYDTNNCFNTSNYRFTPTVAGHYLIIPTLYVSGGSGANEVQIAIQKNGTDVIYPYDQKPTTGWSFNGSGIVYCNGTTDYITIGFYCDVAKTLNSTYTFMSATLLRTA